MRHGTFEAAGIRETANRRPLPDLRTRGPSKLDQFVDCYAAISC